MNNGKWLRILISLFAFVILTRFQIDPDLGWHLAIGKKFIEFGEIIRGDQFTWTMPGYLWGNSYFLYQILVAFLFKNFGWVASVFFFGAVVALSVLMILPKKINLWAFLIVGLSSVVAFGNVGVRAHNLDWPFFGLLLLLIYKKRFRERIFIPFWFLFFSLWANIHVGFAFGLLIFLLMLVLDFAEHLGKGALGQFWTYFLAGVFALLGTFLTPFHFLMWKSIIFDSAGLVGWSNIYALQSTAIFFPQGLFLAFSGLLFVYMLRFGSKKIEVAWLLVSGFVFLLAFFVTDFAYVWSIIFIFLGTRFFDLKLKLFMGRLEKIFISAITFLVCLALLLNFFVNYLESRTLAARFFLDGYPVSAVNFLVREKLFVGLFNEYSWGGYIDWQAPELKVFIDGRLAGWKKADGRPILSDYLDILRGRCEVLKNYDIRVVLIKKDVKTDCFSGFSESYSDSVSKVLVK